MIADQILRIMPERDHSPLVKLAGTLALVAVGILSREMLDGWLTAYPLLMFIPVVFLTALFFGAKFGMAATILSVASAAYFFIPPRYSFSIGWTAAVPVLIFAIICLLQCALIAALRTTLRKLSLAERRNSLLYAELHHRTRNDLSMISSSLELRARASASEEVRQAYEFAVAQILAIAASQSRLQDGGSTRIDLKAYLAEICHGFRALLAGTRAVHLGLRSEALLVPRDVAVTVGLIVNELVTNALKYAFPHDRKGRIDVEVQGGQLISILVTDDGVGPASETKGSGLGTDLIASLLRPYQGTITRAATAQGYAVTATLALPREDD